MQVSVTVDEIHNYARGLVKPMSPEFQVSNG